MSTAATALSNKLYQVITGGLGVPPRSFISFVGGGIALDSDHMSWSLKEPPYAGDVDADNAAAFANLVDTIPDSGPWTAGTANMGKAYRDVWLNNAQVPDLPLTPAQKKEIEDNQGIVDQFNDDYSLYREDWQNKNMIYQLATLAQHDASYFQNLLLARKDVTTALTAWQTKGHKASFEHANAIVQHYSEMGFLTAIQRLKDDYDGVLNTNTTSTAALNFTPVQLFPKNFLAAGGPVWNHFHIDESEFSKFQNSISRSYSSGFDVDFLFWNLAAGASSSWESRNFLQISTSQLKVDFDFIRVRIDRSSWFDSFLLTSNSWWWNGATKSNPDFGGPLLSNGAAPRSTEGQWQMIPTEMIVTRGLSVDVGTFDLQHSAFASGSQSSSSSGFWFWSTSDTNSSSTSSSFDHHFASNSVLVAPQPQIVAFICQLMPKEPNPDPRLLPS
jgi:hypothetical protein